MIYLIGGSPRCGKTTVANKLAKDLKIPCIASDTLESMVSLYVSKEDYYKHFPKRKIRIKTKLSNDLMYGKYSTKEIVDVYVKQAEAPHKAIMALAECELKEGRHYVVEGYHVLPKLAAALKKKYGSKNVRSVFLARYDVGNMIKNNKKHTNKTDWFVQKTKDEATYKKIAAMIALFSKYFEKEAKKYNFRVFNMDKNFKQQLKSIVVFLKKTPP